MEIPAMNKDKIEGGVRKTAGQFEETVGRAFKDKRQGKGFTTKPPVLPRTHMGKLRTW